MSGGGVALIISALGGLVAAVSIALWRRRQTQISGWQALVSAMEKRIDALQVRLDATDQTVTELRAQVDQYQSVIHQYQSVIQARDRLIAEHIKWDHEASLALAAAGHQHLPPPPLWPNE